MNKATDTVFRVIRLPESLRKSMKVARNAAGQTNAEFLECVVAEHLPTLVSHLEDLGFGRDDDKIRPTRLPFADSAGTLTALRAASNRVQIPLTQLLQICLTNAVGSASKVNDCRRRHRRPTATKAAIRKRRARKTTKRSNR